MIQVNQRKHPRPRKYRKARLPTLLDAICSQDGWSTRYKQNIHHHPGPQSLQYQLGGTRGATLHPLRVKNLSHFSPPAVYQLSTQHFRQHCPLKARHHGTVGSNQRESIHRLTLAAADTRSAFRLTAPGPPPPITQGEPRSACAGMRSPGLFFRQSATNRQRSAEKWEGSSRGAGASTMVWTRSMAVASSCTMTRIGVQVGVD